MFGLRVFENGDAEVVDSMMNEDNGLIQISDDEIDASRQEGPFQLPANSHFQHPERDRAHPRSVISLSVYRRSTRHASSLNDGRLIVR